MEGGPATSSPDMDRRKMVSALGPYTASACSWGLSAQLCADEPDLLCSQMFKPRTAPCGEALAEVYFSAQ